MTAIADYMQKTGHRLKDVAERIGVGTTMVHYLRTGDRDPSPGLARTINERLGIPLYKLRPDIWRGPQ